LALTLARRATSVSIPTTGTHGLTGSGDDNGVASAITDGRQMTSIQDKASPLVLSDKLLDWLISLLMGIRLPSFFHGNLLDFRNEWLILGWGLAKVLEGTSVPKVKIPPPT
jgi:hypothetical protein